LFFFKTDGFTYGSEVNKERGPRAEIAIGIIIILQHYSKDAGKGYLRIGFMAGA
jgi:hypothetical protein